MRQTCSVQMVAVSMETRRGKDSAPSAGGKCTSRPRMHRRDTMNKNTYQVRQVYQVLHPLRQNSEGKLLGDY